MVKYCAAYNCSNADTKLNRKQGITFHRFPRDNKKKQQWAQAVHRADPVSGKLWTPSEWDMICSQHFNPDCFKEINGKKFLKEGSCPSIFSFPDNFQRIDNSLRRSAKNSKCAGTFLENPPLTADPAEVYVTVTKTANNSKRLTENFSSAHELDTNVVCNTQDTVMTDHHYHITDSPKTLKRKLDELLAENHKLRRKLRNASDQEERLHKNMEILLDKLHSKDMSSWEIK
ncbi:THAP domain-containing protein 6-like [Gopherus flavomarginatus]|uniref:THAP domain-containing protein 6-like n=1 Tax=Gopherus flavomarginatus TaxID=286002 RepID=UPI0021CBF6C7|nr:THAP domain-containing protein 6-like [Gopherus flavomarginatus]XP_050803104.1 THAP domain-containing protein 6-like [Gopherus flavomarginatus]XP_050803105.1 THAP domain-containing protein 6-like [Gopherus flavomarginatus]XP_050803106.1 THAP domain-containing protein 6-like [Gopherus flavomarginatus]XP_050803107.1 THAP domain-containing protein 6-like [Gopherus flavomarginatus]XP_050803108.1 THAP domain-containing protein 6-like [Gopherus flavomarginatus]XP_050803109.1 THAP domain-containi